MSNKALNWAINIPLKGGQKSILLLIANALNKEGICWPNTETLMFWSGYSRRSVLQYVKDLVDNKIINRKYEHNKKGYRKKTIYSVNFDLKLDQIKDKILSANTAPRKEKPTSLGANTACLSANTACLSANTAPTPSYSIDETKVNRKENHDFSPGDNFNEQKQQAVIGVKFEQLRKVYEDSYNIENARRLFFKLCSEDEQCIQFADNLIKIRKQQIIDFNKQIKAGKLMPTPCSLFKWLEGKRWLDIIKPLGDKKKVSPYVKCKCGEEYLRGSYCGRCEELKKPRLSYA